MCCIVFGCGLPLITVSDADIAVADSEVKLCELLGGSQAVEGLGDERERVLVLAREFVQHAIVNAETKGAVGLLDKENRSAAGRRRRPNMALGQVILNLVAQRDLFGGR